MKSKEIKQLFISGSNISYPNIINAWLNTSAILEFDDLLTPEASSLPFFTWIPK